MKKYLAVFLIVGFIGLGCSGESREARQTILQLLESQKKAWNSGDLEGYLSYYWKSDELTFQSGASRIRGWEALFERYKKSYSGENMGRLDFEGLKVILLGQDHALVLGRWKVTVQGEKKGGVFTLILRRLSEGWRIIHDHTSWD